MTASRKLAAILAADVVGYSRMMGEDEAGTASLVRERREAAQPIIAAHGGRLFKTMGDGMFVEFPSVVAAVECALAMQRQMAASNEGAPEAKRVLYRIGVHLGDVLGRRRGHPRRRRQHRLAAGRRRRTRRRIRFGCGARARAREDRGGIHRPRREGAQEHRAAGACLCRSRRLPTFRARAGRGVLRSWPASPLHRSCFRSPISAAIRNRTISSMA